MKDNVLLLKIIFDFLSQLNEKQLDDLLNKKAKLKLDTIEKEIEVTKDFSLNSICNELERKNSREDALEYLGELNLNKQNLKTLVRYYKIPMASKATNIQMTDAIIEAVIGSKLRYDALYNTELK